MTLESDDEFFITRDIIGPTGEGQLSGLTVGIKDNISTKGVRTTCGSAMLQDYEPPYDATVVNRISQAGGEILGKTNMDEFGMGSTTETSAFGPSPNPVDETRVPGGSSGGSAAAVATGAVDVALGSDTGGSIRCPAAFCGVVGIKPTYGLVSRYGLVAYGNSLEQIGPIADSVEDAARLLEVIAGPDPRDATTVDSDPDGLAAAVREPVEDMTIGIPSELVDGVDESVAQSFASAVEQLRELGVRVQDLSLPSVDHAIAAYYIIAMSEASSNLARFDGVRYGLDAKTDGNWNDSFASVRNRGFGDEVKRRILLGTFALSEGYHDKYYKKAQDARALVQRDFDRAFDEVDVIASPTMPTLPFRRGTSLDDPLTMYLADANTVPANLANVPAVSVPTEPAEGLPVGCQLVGPAFGERRLIRMAAAIESAV